jgi:hypothetical protein
VKIAIMQPYFFPYIGYWQLIHAVDCFVLFDDVQYIRHGWINRNRVLKPEGGWQYVVVPLRKHESRELIKNVLVHPDNTWKERILAQLAQYKKKARYFVETYGLVREALFSTSEQGIAALNCSIIKTLCSALDLKKDIRVSSAQQYDYTNVGDAGEWALRIAEQMGATEYINPIGGQDLFSREKYLASGITLSFLKPNAAVYAQPGDFIPALSIIDVLMFNGVKGSQQLLEGYEVIAASECGTGTVVKCDVPSI